MSSIVEFVQFSIHCIVPIFDSMIKMNKLTRYMHNALYKQLAIYIVIPWLNITLSVKFLLYPPEKLKDMALKIYNS